MKIMQIYVVLLVFVFINVQVEGAIEFSSSEASPSSIFQFVLKVFTFVVDIINPDKTQVNVVQILEQVGDMSIKLDTFDTHMNNKLDTMLDTLMAAIKVTPTLEYSKKKLFQYISKIDRYFDNSREYKFGGMLGNDTLENFATSALWCGDNLPNILQKLNDLFIANVNKPGLLLLMHQQNLIERVDDCNKYQLDQLHIYYIYIQLIMAEVKGLLTLGQIFMLQRLFDKTSHNYLPEMEIVKTNFVKRMTTYHEVFSQDLKLFSPGLRRCDILQSPIRNLDFLEMENFSRIFLLQLAFPWKTRCTRCPTETELRDLHSDYTIHDCKILSTKITYCPAEPETPREMIWWKDDETKIQYGHDAACASTETLIRPDYIVLKTNTILCDVCVCSKYQNMTKNSDVGTIWRVSVSEQMSDRRNNMVVTGVKFRIYSNALHLQIQQSRISNYGLSFDESQWKELDEYNENGVTQYISLKYEPLNYNRRTLHLDEIMAPENYVVTGVRFQLNSTSEFELGVHVTRYNEETGQLSLSDSLWMFGYDFPVNDDYYRGRIEIDLDESDDPTRASGFEYDSESNKKIKFRPTDMKKDAGQMTIPLLDAHPIETNPPSPLSGIGLSFRGKVGFGGYIAPHIYTIDAMSYVKYNLSQFLNDIVSH